jgi:hypothetical protein
VNNFMGENMKLRKRGFEKIQNAFCGQEIGIPA